MKSSRVLGRGAAWTLGLLLVGCGGGSVDSREEQQPPSEEPPFVPIEEVPSSGTIAPAPAAGDSGAPNDGSDGSDGTDAGAPAGDDSGTPPPDVGEPPASGGPAQHGRHWRASYYAGVAPGGLAVGDLNGDGAPDVAVNDLGAGLLSQYKAPKGGFVVLLNDGKGGLEKPSTRRSLPSSSGRIAVGHGDADGVLDVVLGTHGGALFLAGKGDGSFVDASTPLARGHISNLGFWSGQGEGAPRVWAVGSDEPGYQGPPTDAGFGLLVSTGSGLLQPRGINWVDGQPLVPWTDEATAAAVGDFNGDGHLDIVLSSDRWPLSRFFETPAHTFMGEILAERRVDLLTSADVNGDGRADLVAVDGKELWTYLGRSDGNFSLGLMQVLPTQPSRVVVADVDDDRKPDVLLLDREAGQLTLWRGNGRGGFDAHAVLATGRQPSDAAVADLDRDGVSELLVAEAGDNVVSVYTVPREPVTEAPLTPRCPMNLRDDVAPGAAPEPLLTMKAGVGTEKVAVADFDGNGHLDLALGTYDSGVRLLLGDADGHFRTHDVLRGRNVEHLAAGDFDGDGRTDLAVVGMYGAHLVWGRGQGDFEEETTYIHASVAGGGHLVAADFNHDGRMDLAASLTAWCNTWGYLLMNQGGRDLKLTALPDHNIENDDQCGSNIRPIVADFNRDGLLDLVHTTLALNLNYLTKEGAVLPGEGFNAVQYTSGRGTYSAGDVDGDGAVDLLLSDEMGLRVLRGDAGGTLESELSCRLDAAGKAQLEAVDVNADGITDLLGRDSAGVVVVSLGKGGGAYGPVMRYRVDPWPLWAAPVNVLGDSRPELVVLTASGTLTVFPTP
ncbi:VCBS repeat-containing protein [Pyxidicoccus parkwayensis]|uniref:VCBS repeat-containing protein n=1 Tax=Pyxidicoccus parkwayensis TaxID=2813578 RepID=A0ABX7NLL1_9BACT|nr:VCBS repeat-containing protein [Pyxidicoccus parkwaysis]QSQ19254.1 VCBS repeat-containing protein [Pyxidicoccus parkwaysis]